MKRTMIMLAMVAMGTATFALGSKEDMSAADAAAALDAMTAASAYAPADIDAAKATLDALLKAGIEPRSALEMLEEAVDEGLTAADFSELAALASSSTASSARRLERELEAFVNARSRDDDESTFDDDEDDDDEDEDIEGGRGRGRGKRGWGRPRGE